MNFMSRDVFLSGREFLVALAVIEMVESHLCQAQAILF